MRILPALEQEERPLFTESDEAVCLQWESIRHIKLVLSSACLIYSTLNSTDRIMH